VYYYLGMAIRELIEKEDSVDAANVLQAYLDKGAPLGDEGSVRQYVTAVRSREVNPTTTAST
jgi:putative IMPACT (imprinted ancient) family translation regulator